MTAHEPRVIDVANPEAVIRPDGYVAWVAGGTDLVGWRARRPTTLPKPESGRVHNGRADMQVTAGAGPSRGHFTVASLVAVAVLFVGPACGNCKAGNGYGTYAWDGSKWLKLATSGGAETAEGFGYNPDLGAVMGVGGGVPNQTFKWTGHEWESLNAPACCSGENKLLAYDYEAHRMLMFADDIYEWAGGKWDRSQLPGPSQMGPSTVLTGIAYDRKAKHFVGVDLFRGATLIFDGVAWKDAAASPFFTPLIAGNFSSLVYDSIANRLVAVGRNNHDSGDLHLATWDGKQWSLSAMPLPADMAEVGYALGYDPTRNVVLLSGRKHLWTWDGSQIKEVPGGENASSLALAGVDAKYRDLAGSSLAAAAFDDRAAQLIWINAMFTECPPGS